MTRHPDIGKRVKWRGETEEGYGKLMAVDCDRSVLPHLVQREDGGGHELVAFDARDYDTSARSQGVKDGTKNLQWVCSYEVVPDNKPVAFASNKNAKELGIDTSREFVVVDATGSHYLKEGDIFRLDRDDQSVYPYFRRVSDGYISSFRWDRFAYAPLKEPVPLLPTLRPGLEEIFTFGFDTREAYPIVGSMPADLTSTKPNLSFMSNILRKVKDLALSKTDRTLRKHSFENDCGEMTQAAKDYALDLILKERWALVREQLAKDIAKVEKED